MSQRPRPVASDQIPAARPDPSDTELVARIRAGDAAAFEALFEEYFTSLCGFVMSYVKDAAVAEELVQDLFCALWRRRAEWHPPGRVRHYLLAAARNRAITHLRHRQIVDRGARRWTGPAAAAGDIPGLGVPLPGPERELELTELANACRRAIHALPERRRLIVTLRWQHQMTHAEIAHTLGISVKGVEVQLGRALKAMRKYFEADRSY